MSRQMRTLATLAAPLLLLRLFPPSGAQGLSSYLPLHTAMETFAIVVSMLVFGVGWNAYSSERPGNVVLLSCAFLAVGLIDFAHVLSYPGMPPFVTPSSPEKAINFWLAARFVESGALLTVAALPWRPLASERTRYLLLAAGVGLTAAVYWVGLFHADALPRTFIEGKGLTPFKIGAEYAVVAIHLVTVALLALRARRPQPFDVANLMAAAGTVSLSELCFTLYASVTDAFNLLGHVYKIIAYAFIYRAVFVDSVQEPYRRLREARETIWEQKERAQVTLQSIGDGVITTDAAGRVEYLNPVAEALTGWSTAAARGLPLAQVFRLVDDLTGEPAGDPVVECLRRGGVVALAERAALVRQDGRRVAVEDSAAPIRDRAGRVAGAVLVFRDVTERRQAEEARARLSALLEATSDLVVLGTADGRVLYLNDAARKALGFGPDEPLDLRCADLYPERERGRILDEAVPAALRGGMWRGETAFRSRDGEEIPVSLVVVAYRSPRGRVEFLSAVARDISERKRYEAQLEYLADHDALTGLLNRRRLEQELSGLLEGARGDAVGAVLSLDLDNFKYVNDALGHRAGDELLTALAGLLRERLPEQAILARVGGDEFAALLPGADAERAREVAEQVLAAARGRRVVVAGQALDFTLSIGIALFPEHGGSADELLARADLALWRAKEDGRNRWSLYSPGEERHARAQLHLAWEKRIRQALEADRFLLYLQPILDLRRNRISRYEALLRMRDENGGVVLPGAFLDVAERFGLIRDLDRWVARQAIRLLASHRRDGRRLCLEVNLSGKAFADPELLSLIQEELDRGQVDPADLVFEITETAAVANIGEAQRFLETLKGFGCRFALDDFGVGFSSFNYLKHLPVDCLKIDGSFIRDLPRSPVDQHLVKAIVEVARGLGKETIAECVGDGETLRLLRECGVDYAQGFHVGRPAPVAEVLGGRPGAAASLDRESAGGVV